MDLPRYHRLRRALYNLEGSRCSACGARHFPAQPRCSCGNTTLEPHRFAGRGTLFSFSEVFASPEGFDSPYVLGLVDLDEGVRVLAQITDADPDSLEIGMPLEMVIRRIQADGPSGAIVYGYKFRPV